MPENRVRLSRFILSEIYKLSEDQFLEFCLIHYKDLYHTQFSIGMTHAHRIRLLIAKVDRQNELKKLAIQLSDEETVEQFLQEVDEENTQLDKLMIDIIGQSALDDNVCTFHFLQDKIDRQQTYTPLQHLPHLFPQTQNKLSLFSFSGVHWSSVYGFSLFLCQADHLTLKTIKGVGEQFVEINNSLYIQPKQLELGFLSKYLLFTLAGVLCFVYEQGLPPEKQEDILNIVYDLKSVGPAYDKGLTDLFGVQRIASSFVWVVDLKNQRLYKHQGKSPDVVNYHAKSTLSELKALEATLRCFLDNCK